MSRPFAPIAAVEGGLGGHARSRHGAHRDRRRGEGCESVGRAASRRAVNDATASVSSSIARCSSDCSEALPCQVFCACNTPASAASARRPDRHLVPQVAVRQWHHDQPSGAGGVTVSLTRPRVYHASWTGANPQGGISAGGCSRPISHSQVIGAHRGCCSRWLEATDYNVTENRKHLGDPRKVRTPRRIIDRPAPWCSVVRHPRYWPYSASPTLRQWGPVRLTRLSLNWAR